MSWQGDPDPDQTMTARLRALRVDPPDAGFGAALHRSLVEAGSPPPPSLLDRGRDFFSVFSSRPAVAWPMAGLASGVAAFALLVALRGAPGVSIPAPEPTARPHVLAAAYEVPSSKVAVIRLNFTAEVAVENVGFSITLPDGISFWNDGEKLSDRSFHWRGRLGAGDNTIPVAVRGERAGHYRVLASADVDGTKLRHEVVLEVTEG